MSSIVERDFFKRTLEQLAALARALLRLRQEQRHVEAMATLEGAYGPLLGLEKGPLTCVDSASAAALLADPLRIATFAQLLLEEAEVAEASGSASRPPAALRAHAFELLVEAQARRDEAALRERLAALARDVDPEALAPGYRGVHARWTGVV